MPSADRALPVFVQPLFAGGRFASHVLPLDIAGGDLKAYQTLLIDLAKHLYRIETGRKSVPTGFAKVSLAIQNVEPGSALPSLVLVPAAIVAPAPVPVAAVPPLPIVAAQMVVEELPSEEFEWQRYYDRARDMIADCIAAPSSARPTDFPENLLSHFNKLGSSLRDDETLELHTTDQMRPAILNPQKRRSLVLAVNAVYEKEVELEGYIGAEDWDNHWFRLRLDGATPVQVMVTKAQSDQVKPSGGRQRDRVFIKGIAQYDSSEHLLKVVSVEALDVIKNYRIATRFDALAQFTNGWCNGSGTAPNKAGLEVLARKMVELYPENLHLPTITPTLDGNLLFEWGTFGHAGVEPCIGGGPSANIDLGSLTVCFYYVGADGKDTEKHFDGKDTIESFIEFLPGFVPQQNEGIPTDTSVTDARSLYTIAAERLIDLETGRTTSHPIEELLQVYGLVD